MKNFNFHQENIISSNQIAEGMHLCFKNAESLMFDAELLKNNGRVSRGFSLAVLALEELAKTIILSNAIAIQKDDSRKWKAFWKRFRSHKDKQGIWGAYGLGALKDMGFNYETEVPAGLEHLIDSMKMNGFYVFLYEENFRTPENFFEGNDEWIEYIFSLARERIAHFKPLYDTLSMSKMTMYRMMLFMVVLKTGKALDMDKLLNSMSEDVREYVKRFNSSTYEAAMSLRAKHSEAEIDNFFNDPDL